MKNLYTTIVTTLLLSLNASAQDYTTYNELLSKYAKADGVDYKSWAKSSKCQGALDDVLTEWAKVDASKLKKNDQAAFRINLYNAAMIDAALSNYPLKSVTEIGEKFSIFDKAFIKTPKGSISLNTLEKKTLLRDFPDSRIHFAVNCASISCPPLRNEAYTGEKLEAQLEEQTKQFSDSAHAVKVSGSTAKYSKLFEWYAKDFKTDPKTYLNKYRTNKLKSSLKTSWQDYDWGLNQSAK